ncbi:MAG: GyrI-like domain-containing protein [Candidatus Cloacimonetes bacterium]|nr:GyrI-like domain-containing protein [Candidatus Cloacimonadota bacterium]
MSETKDYKKDFKALYLPKITPVIIDVPEITFVALQGKGNPNEKDGEYQKALGVLYSIQYAIKMSKKGKRAIEGYFDYVVPPLEGLWWLDKGETFSVKSKYNWISLIRLPEFVNEEVFQWACDEVSTKKVIETKVAKYIKIQEGLCVQCLHVGSYDSEPETLKKMENFCEENDLLIDLTNERRHHELYLSDPRKTDVSKLKTILRIPVKKR